MKKLLILLFPVACWGQQYTYKHVDTLIQYKDAQIVVVGNKRDTFYISKKYSINIGSVDVMIIDDRKNLPKPKK